MDGFKATGGKNGKWEPSQTGISIGDEGGTQSNIITEHLDDVTDNTNNSNEADTVSDRQSNIPGVGVVHPLHGFLSVKTIYNVNNIQALLPVIATSQINTLININYVDTLIKYNNCVLNVILEVIRGGGPVDVLKYITGMHENIAEKVRKFSESDLNRLTDVSRLNSAEDICMLCSEIHKRSSKLEQNEVKNTELGREILYILCLLYTSDAADD